MITDSVLCFVSLCMPKNGLEVGFSARFEGTMFFQRVRAQREGRRHAHLRIKLPPGTGTGTSTGTGTGTGTGAGTGTGTGAGTVTGTGSGTSPVHVRRIRTVGIPREFLRFTSKVGSPDRREARADLIAVCCC